MTLTQSLVPVCCESYVNTQEENARNYVGKHPFVFVSRNNNKQALFDSATITSYLSVEATDDLDHRLREDRSDCWSRTLQKKSDIETPLSHAVEKL